MLGLHAIDLARFQFAFTVSFHIIFPAFSIGLASYLMVLEGLWLKTGKDVYIKLYHFWIRIFAVAFGLGVVSGVVMAYEFGTNWSGFAEKAGDITGVLLTYEVLTAFFLEAGFLGIMLFGQARVSKRLHFFATCMVAIGTLISATWILMSNSWMQTPAGFEMVDGRFEPVSWLEIMFNPSFPYRLLHMVLAAFISVSFVVGGVGGYHLLRDKEDKAARKMFSMAMWMAVVTLPIQIMVGDAHGLNTLEHQPAKLAAMEGYWGPKSGETGVPLTLFALPNMETAQNDYALEIPNLASLYLTHSLHGEIQGLSSFPKDEWPDVPLVFWSFRIMVGLGMAMLGIGVLGLFLRWRKRLYDTRWFHRLTFFTLPIGFIAIVAGWVTTEAGRQPWVIYGLLKTVDAVSPLNAGSVAASLSGFIVVYAIIFGIGIYYMAKLIRKEPMGDVPDGGPGHERHPKRPFSVVEQELDDEEVRS
ncbi:cytochrome ubiquinol oxidase subunit I [Larsenimonas suaedae]|uniref:Cytochrome ubiquinol oxidase subunit I n=1 Tax=Larsenimonas suaedae TaxID=1851019 RepID=A0ABU1GZ10_9GAMM|nr:cytochrome ubiquinol oxidase subunit I [Larsenimonas suaedae]MCM2973623.1 cytochrome ubiquinol oxidase subunit I [Larsenimonas suaedae]MDR5897243.1 cytochrome ubiquinol oxidase subunit I [Larsenimonas suaedae]